MNPYRSTRRRILWTGIATLGVSCSSALKLSAYPIDRSHRQVLTAKTPVEGIPGVMVDLS